MPESVLILRHMEERHNDHVAQFLTRCHAAQTHVNPAHGVPLPRSHGAFDALVIYGGIQSANDGANRPYIAEELDWIADWLAAGKPLLGICLGAQLVAKCLGAKVERHPQGLVELGFSPLADADGSAAFLNGTEHFYQWHNEGFTLPDNCELLARGEVFPNQAFRYRSNTFCVQFHPEVTRKIMLNWLDSGSDFLSVAGAHSADRQKSDETQYGQAMSRWCWNFVDQWFRTW